MGIKYFGSTIPRPDYTKLPSRYVNYLEIKNIFLPLDSNSIYVHTLITSNQSTYSKQMSKISLLSNLPKFQNSELVKPCHGQLSHFETFPSIKVILSKKRFKYRLILVPILKTLLGLKRKLSWVWLSTKEGILRLETVTRVRWFVDFLTRGNKKQFVLWKLTKIKQNFRT